MNFTDADYPFFLGAVFFLYGLARAGSWPGAIGRWAVMLLLGDLAYLLLTKDTRSLWDPLGGYLYHRLARHASVPAPGLPPLWHWVIGVGVVGGFGWLGHRWAGSLAGDRVQRWLGRGVVGALIAIGLVVLLGHEAGALDAVTAWFSRYGHLGFLIALSTAIGASGRAEGRTFARLVILFLVSCIFYQAWASPMRGGYKYLLALLLGTIVLDYYLALWIARTQEPGQRRILLVFSLVSNLGILAVFKYVDFFTLDVLGLDAEPLALILPAGISFHTFQSMSYTVDVYRRQLEPTRSVLQFATFVLFFPQLVAGPIVRATELMPQLTDLPRYDYAKAADGLFRILVGLFKKVGISDFLAIALIDRAFDDPAHFSSVEMLVAVYAYALQIYLDFSAYSDIAIGSAKLLGFDLPENFRTPYRSSNLQEFWRRWHISLSTWLRDYLYIPLGGSKRGGWFTYRNLIITMLLGGLWHGASWTFIVWGALHGFGLAATRVFQRMLDAGRSLDRVLLGAYALAVVGLGAHYLLPSPGAWASLVLAWCYLVPGWAALTVLLSSEPVVLTGGTRPRPTDALYLRAAALGCGALLLAALHGGATGLWLPLAIAAPVLAGLADLAELGLDEDQLARVALAGASRVVAGVLVFHYVCLAWVFFRATSFDHALAVLERIGAGETDAANLTPAVMIAVVIGFVAHCFPDRTFHWLRARFVELGPMEQAAVLTIATFILRELSHPTIVPFIYFQF